jgi:hypothetical protein
MRSNSSPGWNRFRRPPMNSILDAASIRNVLDVRCV